MKSNLQHWKEIAVKQGKKMAELEAQLKEMQQQKILTSKNVEKVIKGQKETIDLFRSQLKERDELIKEAYVDGFNDTKYDFDIENYVE